MTLKRKISCLGMLCLSINAILPANAQIVVSPATMLELKTSPLPKPQETILEPKLLTLQEAIVLALRNNPAIHSSRFQRISDKWALELANYAYQPQLSLTGNVIFTQGERVGYNVSPGVTLNTRYGTQFTVSQTNNTDNRGQQTQATVTQPLIRGSGFVNIIPWLNAQDSELTARQTFKNSAMDMVSQVITNYRKWFKITIILKFRKKPYHVSSKPLSNTS